MPRLPHHRQRAFWACPTVEVTGFEPAVSCTCSSWGVLVLFRCSTRLSYTSIARFTSGPGNHPFSAPQLWQSHLLLRCGRLAMLFFALHFLQRTHWGLRPPPDDDDAVCHAIATPYGVGDKCTGISTLYHNPDLGLIYIIANKLTYVNRSCSNWSMPL